MFGGVCGHIVQIGSPVELLSEVSSEVTPVVVCPVPGLLVVSSLPVVGLVELVVEVELVVVGEEPVEAELLPVGVVVALVGSSVDAPAVVSSGVVLVWLVAAAASELPSLQFVRVLDSHVSLDGQPAPSSSNAAGAQLKIRTPKWTFMTALFMPQRLSQP